MNASTATTATARQQLAAHLAASTTRQLIAAQADCERHDTDEHRILGMFILDELICNRPAIRDWIARRGVEIFTKFQNPLEEAAEARGESYSEATAPEYEKWEATPYSEKMRMAVRALGR